MDLLKNLNNMITAEELLDNIEIWDGVFVHSKNAKQAMIKFAKLHVTEALKEAFNNSEMRVSENDTNEIPSFTDNYDDGYVTITVSKNSILNAYPLENIK